MQQSLFIQNWALCPSSYRYPSMKQCVVLDGAVHVCVNDLPGVAAGRQGSRRASSRSRIHLLRHHSTLTLCCQFLSNNINTVLKAHATEYVASVAKSICVVCQGTSMMSICGQPVLRRFQLTGQILDPRSFASYPDSFSVSSWEIASGLKTITTIRTRLDQVD